MNGKIDLHIHTRVSDGSDPPEEIAARVRDAGVAVFSVTDHDAIKGCQVVQGHLGEGDPAFICGVEFSCKDALGQYHILGYAYDPQSRSIQDTVDKGHSLRMKKVRARLDFIRNEFGFDFPGDEMEKRLKRLIGYGLQGVEAYYSGFSPKLTGEMLVLADRYGLYVTAGSDYHGSNKLIALGDTGMEDHAPLVRGMQRFLDAAMTIPPAR